MKGLSFLAAANLVALLGAGGAGYYYLNSQQTSAEAAPAAPKKNLGLVDLDPFLTNIAGPRGEHHIRMQVKLAISPSRRADELRNDALLVTRLRDNILTILTTKSVGELSTPQGREQFRRELLAAANGLTDDVEVEEALFTDFVIQ